jgi:uncharacterized protein (TIGR00730 family)
VSEVKRVCVFCGSSGRAAPPYFDAARALARELAAQGLGVVYGGASVGLMGALADEALARGAEVLGVMPKHLVDREVAHESLTELFVVDSMHERKAKMHDLSDAFVALPGGLGTLEELFEIATWAQLGLHQKPIFALDVAGFFESLRAYLDHAVREGLLAPAHHALILFETNPARLVSRIRTHEPPHFETLIDRGET